MKERYYVSEKKKKRMKLIGLKIETNWYWTKTMQNQLIGNQLMAGEWWSVDVDVIYRTTYLRSLIDVAYIIVVLWREGRFPTLPSSSAVHHSQAQSSSWSQFPKCLLQHLRSSYKHNRNKHGIISGLMSFLNYIFMKSGNMKSL